MNNYKSDDNQSPGFQLQINLHDTDERDDRQRSGVAPEYQFEVADVDIDNQMMSQQRGAAL